MIGTTRLGTNYSCEVSLKSNEWLRRRSTDKLCDIRHPDRQTDRRKARKQYISLPTKVSDCTETKYDRKMDKPKLIYPDFFFEKAGDKKSDEKVWQTDRCRTKVIPKCLLCQRQAQQQDSKIDTEFVLNNWMYGYRSWLEFKTRCISTNKRWLKLSYFLLTTTHHCGLEPLRRFCYPKANVYTGTRRIYHY